MLNLQYQSLWHPCITNLSWVRYSIVMRWSGFFCKAFLINILASIESYKGSEKSHYIDTKLHSLYFSLFIFEKCGKMVPFLWAFRKQGLLLPRYRQNCHKISLLEFRGRHNPMSHNMFFFALYLRWPIRNHIACRHPK